MAGEYDLPKGELMRGKRGVILGVANHQSMAWGIASQLASQGAELAFGYMEMNEKRVRPLGESIVLRYQNGLFLPEGGVNSLDKLAHESKAEEVFMDLLRRFTGQGRNVSDKKTAPTYAPSEFAAEDEAKKHRLKKDDFKPAMSRLFAKGKVHVEQYGRPSRPYSRLAIKDGQ